MIQLVKLKFDCLDYAIKKVNWISMNYDYLVDYGFIVYNDLVNAVLKFDVPPVEKELKLSKLQKFKGENQPDECRGLYNITTIDGEKYSGCHLISCRYPEHLKIKGDIGDLVKIEYKNLNSFELTLYDLKFDIDTAAFYTEEKEIRIVNDIDYIVVYENIVKVMLEEGYLFDKTSLNYLKQSLSWICTDLNLNRFQTKKMY